MSKLGLEGRTSLLWGKPLTTRSTGIL